MKFVRTAELKPGMRLAKPIYNKNGVLLYDRNSKLTFPGINSISNFGLIGIYILEPAEPLPPLSKEDIEFEQCQTVYMFKLRDVFDKIQKKQRIPQIQEIVLDIDKRYGSLDHRMNFNQNLRSADDFVYKHSISTSILVAMISHYMMLSAQEKSSLIAAALLYDIGYLFVHRNILEKGNNITKGDQDSINQCLERGLNLLYEYNNDYSFMPKAVELIEYFILSQTPSKKPSINDESLEIMYEVLRVATKFDQMTAMNLNSEPESEIMAMRHLKEDGSYDEEVISALGHCIHIAPAGASIDLASGDRAIILAENTEDFMKPLILRLHDNQLFDLSDPNVARHISISDIMKTMDNRVAIDEHTLEHFVADDAIRKTAARFRERKARMQYREWSEKNIDDDVVSKYT